jgi:hypothetical protein
MRLLIKEFYALSELQSAWEMADHDVQYLVLTGDLKLTIMVHGVHLTSRLPGWGYRYGKIARTYSGILDLKIPDADYVLRHGQVSICKFDMPNGDKGQLVDVDQKVLVRREDLLVTHDQRENIEHNILKLHAPASEASSSDFEYSWDYRRIEYAGETFTFGPKQARVVQLLHRAHIEGDPWRTGQQLLDHAGSSADRVRDLFKSQSAWPKLIVSDGRGLYRLAIPTCSNTPEPMDLRYANPRAAAR